MSRGRPRQHGSNADRQRAYRARRREYRNAHPIEGKKAPSIPVPPADRQCSSCTSSKPCRSCLHAWNSYLARIKYGVSRGLYMTNAPHGCGQLVCGGYDGAKLEQVNAAHDNAESGRKVKGANFVEHKFNGDFIRRQANEGPDTDEEAMRAYQQHVADARWHAEQEEIDRMYEADYQEPKSRKR